MTGYDLSAIPFDPWWAVPANLARLWVYLQETGRAPIDVVCFLEDPSVYDDEFHQMDREWKAAQL